MCGVIRKIYIGKSIGEVTEIELLIFNIPKMMIEEQNTNKSTETAILPMQCYEMLNDEKQLELIGFKHYPDWDFADPYTPNYRLDLAGKTFRAKVTRCNGPVYTQMGIVINEKGHVDRWRDCCSKGSVARKVVFNIA